ncbi:GntR family transcriptional regulator [Alicyclobacillus sp.]|uniref:GntR family transcriptional regulator n=1 Tax=Alicyclobacillus sp. TaxID=61169 RepID=UPI0025C6831E|nr:GntR family transcriptional regulator [Alicyclobacillus sp.]MCL6516984.1 GntR family transcriptional regulator [Alicyclobacillus sp.]
MAGTFASAQPIYLQLVDRICHGIVRGEWRPGDKLPSVRDMAVQAGVNPNTVQRVYMELERMGIVETRRGQGTFVTEDGPRLEALREARVRDRIESFVRDMTEMGIAPEDILDGVRRALDRKGSDAMEEA